MKTLICTSWWPTKSPLFADFSRGLTGQFDQDVELFLTTSFAESKFESIVRSMVSAEQYMLNHPFTHLLNVEADVMLPDGFLSRLIEMDKPVIVCAHDQRPERKSFVGDFKTLIDSRIGWGAMLVQRDVLEQIPFESAFRGDYLTPDRLWFKRLLSSNVPVWVDTTERPKLLEQAENGPRSAFQGGTRCLSC